MLKLLFLLPILESSFFFLFVDNNLIFGYAVVVFQITFKRSFRNVCGEDMFGLGCPAKENKLSKMKEPLS